MTILQLITTYQCVWNFLYFRKILPTVKPSNPRFFTWIWFITYSKWREKKLKEIEFILNLTFHHNASLYEKSLFTSDEILEATEWVCVRSYHLYWDSTLKMKFSPICQGKCRQLDYMKTMFTRLGYRYIQSYSFGHRKTYIVD